MDLAAWLFAQYAADEQRAGDLHDVRCAVNEYDPKDCDCGYPRFVLADLAAKRRIMEMHRGAHECPSEESSCGWCVDSDECETMQAHALPYAGRDGYDPAWAPSDS